MYDKTKTKYENNYFYEMGCLSNDFKKIHYRIFRKPMQKVSMIQDIEKYLKKNSDIETVSFDVFDTLLTRKYPDPTDIFLIIEKQFDLPGFKKKRIKAEILARKVSSEVTLSEIYDYIQEYDMDIELLIEDEALEVNERVREIYEMVKSKGKNIICISDMYLDKTFVTHQLEKCGFFDIEKVFVSSEYKSSKETGDLFDDVLSELNISANKLLHIGDNFYSDFKQPKEKGISAFHIQKKSNTHIMNLCVYKEAIMQNTANSLEYAKQLINSNGKNIKSKASIKCEFKWFLFNFKNMMEKCLLLGIRGCIIKLYYKLSKK